MGVLRRRKDYARRVIAGRDCNLSGASTVMSNPDSTPTDPAAQDHYYDDYPRDWDEEDGDDFDCHLMPDGQCGAAGSEMCDFECPNRNSDLFIGSAAWRRKHGASDA